MTLIIASRILTALFLADALAAAAAPRVLDGTRHHLGPPGKPEWEDYASSVAEGRSLEVRFSAEPNRGAATVAIRQRGVKLTWRVRLNNRDLGTLAIMEEPLVRMLAVP